ncbi:hypothetical protein LAX31_24025, partial [Escherichia coli]|nr:hypothetical protein [Escherichia coli]
LDVLSRSFFLISANYLRISAFFNPRKRMEGAKENTRAAQEPHRPEARRSRYCYQPEPGTPSRPAKPD